MIRLRKYILFIVYLLVQSIAMAEIDDQLEILDSSSRRNIQSKIEGIKSNIDVDVDIHLLEGGEVPLPPESFENKVIINLAMDSDENYLTRIYVSRDLENYLNTEGIDTLLESLEPTLREEGIAPYMDKLVVGVEENLEELVDERRKESRRKFIKVLIVAIIVAIIGGYMAYKKQSVNRGIRVGRL